MVSFFLLPQPTIIFAGKRLPSGLHYCDIKTIYIYRLNSVKKKFNLPSGSGNILRLLKVLFSYYFFLFFGHGSGGWGVSKTWDTPIIANDVHYPFILKARSSFSGFGVNFTRRVSGCLGWQLHRPVSPSHHRRRLLGSEALQASARGALSGVIMVVYSIVAKFKWTGECNDSTLCPMRQAKYTN